MNQVPLVAKVLSPLRLGALFIIWYSSAGVSSNEIANETDTSSVDSLRGCLLEGDRNAVYVSVTEDTAKGSVIHQRLPIIGSTSGDSPNKEIQLRVVKGEEFVSLDEAKKQLSLNRRVDRDGEGGITNFEVVLECVPTVRTHTPLLFQQGVNISVFVTVTDVNDNQPEFPQSHYLLSISEELPPGTPVQLDFTAMDKDEEGPNSQIKYRIVDGREEGESDGYLSIVDPLTPQLVIGQRRLDFESTKSFDIVIEAEDEGSPPRRSTALVHVEVMDVDDLSPVFEHEIYTAHINSEDADAISHADGVILKLRPKSLRAYDADSTLDERILYSLPRGLEAAKNFSIDEDTGTIRYFGDMRQLLRTPTVVLAVHAKQHRPERNATAIVVVDRERRNRDDNEGAQHYNYVYHLEMPSKAMPGIELLRLKGSDTHDRRWHYRWMVTDGGSAASLFTLDEATGVLYIADGFFGGVATERTPSEISFKVLAFPLDQSGDAAADSEEDPIEHTIVVTFRSAVSRGAGPIFDEEEYEFSLKLASPPSSSPASTSVVLGQVRASAAPVVVDGKRQADKVFYSLLNMNSHFSLNPDGILVWRGVDEPVPSLQQTSPNIEYRVELIVLAEDGQGRRNFARIVVKLPASRHQVSLSVMFGVACFLFLISNLVLLTVLFGKRIGRRMLGGTHPANRLWLPSLMDNNEGVTITRSIPTDAMEQDFPPLSISNPIPTAMTARAVGASSTLSTRSQYTIGGHGSAGSDYRMGTSAGPDRRSSGSNRGTLISVSSSKSGSRRNN